MIISTTRTEHTLEIFGPRNQAWRPVSVLGILALREPFELADAGHIAQAIKRAEDIWIEQHGHMHSVSFRVSTKISTISARSLKDLTDEPVDRGA